MTCDVASGRDHYPVAFVNPNFPLPRKRCFSAPLLKLRSSSQSLCWWRKTPSISRGRCNKLVSLRLNFANEAVLSDASNPPPRESVRDFRFGWPQ